MVDDDVASNLAARDVFQVHCSTGEPLDEGEVAAVVSAGLSKWDDWEDRGGGLYWHAPTWPPSDEEAKGH
jgi:hypothetical protein